MWSSSIDELVYIGSGMSEGLGLRLTVLVREMQSEETSSKLHKQSVAKIKVNSSLPKGLHIYKM